MSEPLLNWVQVPAVVLAGHQIASGRAKQSPYPQGSIALQRPYFEDRGVNLSGFFLGTLNVCISPYQFEIHAPYRQIQSLAWTSQHPPETFSFCRVNVTFDNQDYSGWIYYPHPETKITHFQSESVLEILAPPIPHIHYGDRVLLSALSHEIRFKP